MLKLFLPALLAALLAGSAANAMTYAVVPFRDGSVALVASGPIGRNEEERFAYAMQVAQVQGAKPTTLILSSPGGYLIGGVKLGIVVRHLGVKTLVGRVVESGSGQRALAGGSCNSACVLVFMAGTDRSVTPGSRVGVHSPHRADADEATNRADLKQLEPALRRYAQMMGVNPALVGVSHAVPHTSIRTLTSAELSRYRLVTGSGNGQTRRARNGRSTVARANGRTS